MKRNHGRSNLDWYEEETLLSYSLELRVQSSSDVPNDSPDFGGKRKFLPCGSKSLLQQGGSPLPRKERNSVKCPKGSTDSISCESSHTDIFLSWLCYFPFMIFFYHLLSILGETSAVKRKLYSTRPVQ